MSDYEHLNETKLCDAIGMLINKARVGIAQEHELSDDAISMISSVILFSVERYSEIIDKDIKNKLKVDEEPADVVHTEDESGETGGGEPGSEDTDSGGLSDS